MKEPTRIDDTGSDDEPDHARRDAREPKSSPADQIMVVVVTVTRTGGFAGLRRTWHAQADTADAPLWIALIDECPWDAADPGRAIAPSGADRFVWRVDAQAGEAAHAAALADPEVQGPWRELIDAVRAAQKSQRPGR